MSQKEIKDKILYLLEEIVNRTNEINQHHPEKDLTLDIDLVRDDLRLLYRCFESLRSVPADTAVEQREDAAVEQREEGTVDKKEAVRSQDEQILPPVQHEQEKPANGNKAVIDNLAEHSNQTIGDQFIKKSDDSLHQRIADQEKDTSIGSRMQQHPVSNLREVIGVNEKFLFINELFNGNIQDYHAAIEKLNSMEDTNAAFDYLNKLGVEYSWDATRSEATIGKLANYVHRRHMQKD